jgi:hypothetical protein
MNPVAIAALAGGALLVYHESTKDSKAGAKVAASADRVALDPGMDALVSEAVKLAIQSETDPAALSHFADALKQAGYSNSAAAVSAAASSKKGT